LKVSHSITSPTSKPKYSTTSLGIVASTAPLHRIPIKKQQQQKEVITTKLVITMVIIAIVKIAVLMLWI
jgi:hypothetical protein